MSNDLAIAAVTATVRHVLDVALRQNAPTPVGSSTVTTMRPDRLADAPGPALNLFLYGVSPNTGRGMTDQPVRRADGTLVRPPLVALDLHYLISAYGSDEHLDAQRMLARGMAALAVDAVLTRRLVAAALDQDVLLDGTQFLLESDLADQIEPVRLSQRALPADELTRLWSLFGQAPYVLSVAYTASPVLVQADVTASGSLPVRGRQVSVTPGPLPQLLGIRTELGNAVARTGAVVTLDGAALHGGVEVLVGPAVFTPHDLSETRLTFTVDATVPAGLQAVRVRGQAGAQTAALALALLPTVSVGTVDDDSVTVAVVPALRAGQRATVALTSLDPATPQVTLTFDQPPSPADRDTIVVPRKRVPPGRWLVRVQVDGVESLPELDGASLSAPALVVASP